jgi:hypothetical protein
MVPVLLRPPPPASPLPADLTVIYDDVATQRLRTCTGCGGPIDTFTLESWSNGRVVAAVMLCPACQRRDPQREAVFAKLEHRYRLCQVVEAETLIRPTGASLRSYPPFRRPAPAL